MMDACYRSRFLLLALFFLLACNSDPKPENKGGDTADAGVITDTTKIDTSGTESPVATASLEEPDGEKSAQEEEQKEEKTPAKKKRPKKRPKVSFASTTYDYGIIMQGDKVEHEFRFKNKGNADLVIKNVSASCGCAQPTYPFLPVAPGEEGVIGVVFDSKGKLGRQKPAITLVTNARPSTYKLYLEGFVDAERAKEPVLPDSTQEASQEKKEGIN